MGTLWRKKHLAAVVALVATSALTLGACGSSTDTGSAPSSDTSTTSQAGASTTDSGSAGSSTGAPTTQAGTAGAVTGKIGVVIKGLDNPFFQYMEQGINAEQKRTGAQVTIQSAASITDTSGQADKLSALANQDYKCYVVNPISGTNLIQGIAQVAAKGIPIVNIDNPVDAKAAQAAGAKIATYIGTDNVAAGKQVADELARIAPSGGDVALVGGIAGDVTSGQRIDGFKQALASNFKVIQEVAANWDRQEAQTQATTILQANPKLAAFFVANDDMAMGVARAVAAANRKGETKVVSVDGIAGVASGDIDAAVAQYPYVVGEMGLEACEAALSGKTLPTKVDTPIALITPDNAQAAKSAYPKPVGSYDDPFAKLLGR